MPLIESRETLQARLSGLLGERTDDEALNFISDTLETYDHLHTRSASAITQQDLDTAVQAKEDEWRNKYKNAFLSGSPVPSDPPPKKVEDKPITIEDLFK